MNGERGGLSTMKICISLVKKMMKKEEGDAFEEEIEELERVKARQAQYYRTTSPISCARSMR